MKKLLSFLFTVALLISLSSAAFAENNEPLSWEEFKPIAENAFGEDAHFVLLDQVNAKIWIPDYLETVPLTDDDLDNDVIACFMPKDESQLIYITYYDVDGLSIQALKTYIESKGSPAIISEVNGIPVLQYYSSESDSLIAVYETADGYFLQLTFFPLSDELSSFLFTIILSSIQPNFDETLKEDEDLVVPVNPVSSLIKK